MNRAQRRASGAHNKSERKAEREAQRAARRREMLHTLTIPCPGHDAPCSERTVVPFGALTNPLALNEALEEHEWTLAVSEGYDSDTDHFTALCPSCSAKAYAEYDEQLWNTLPAEGKSDEGDNEE